MSDSVLTAAKKLAEISKLPWAKVQPIYKSLQGDVAPALPKSAGRQIWHAHPNFISRLIVGILASRCGVSAVEANADFCQATRLGGPLKYEVDSGHYKEVEYLERVVARFLTLPEASTGLKSFEFDPGKGCIRIGHSDPEVAGEYFPHEPDVKAKWMATDALITSTASISTSVFDQCQTAINWKTEPAPYVMGDEAEDE